MNSINRTDHVIGKRFGLGSDAIFQCERSARSKRLGVHGACGFRQRRRDEKPPASRMDS